MLARIASNGVRTIIVETASPFARDLMVQEVGFAKLPALGVKLVAADSPQSFLDDTPTSKLIRQILGAVRKFDKAMVVAKLKGARDRKRTLSGKKVEGRKSHAETQMEAAVVSPRTVSPSLNITPAPRKPMPVIMLRHAGRIGPNGVTLQQRHPLVLINCHNHEGLRTRCTPENESVCIKLLTSVLVPAPGITR